MRNFRQAWFIPLSLSKYEDLGTKLIIKITKNYNKVNLYDKFLQAWVFPGRMMDLGSNIVSKIIKEHKIQNN